MFAYKYNITNRCGILPAKKSISTISQKQQHMHTRIQSHKFGELRAKKIFCEHRNFRLSNLLMDIAAQSDWMREREREWENPFVNMAYIVLYGIGAWSQENGVWERKKW